MDIVLPSKPKIILEKDDKGVYEIEGLYPGYGHTLGNSLRRILLSSLPGAAITTVKIDGVSHEFSTMSGIKEDVINILLNIKGIRLSIISKEPQTLILKAKGQKNITAKDITLPVGVEIINKDLPIVTLTSKDSKLNAEFVAEHGIGYVSKEVSVKDKVDVGTIVLDAIFTPIKRVSYEVENMRVGERTDFNRLRISIQTDGTITPRESLEKSIDIMIKQLKALVGLSEAEDEKEEKDNKKSTDMLGSETASEKIKIDDLNLSSRIISVLMDAGIKTVGGLLKRKEESLLAIEGLGQKALTEIKSILQKRGLTLKK